MPRPHSPRSPLHILIPDADEIEFESPLVVYPTDDVQEYGGGGGVGGDYPSLPPLPGNDDVQDPQYISLPPLVSSPQLHLLGEPDVSSGQFHFNDLSLDNDPYDMALTCLNLPVLSKKKKTGIRKYKNIADVSASKAKRIVKQWKDYLEYDGTESILDKFMRVLPEVSEEEISSTHYVRSYADTYASSNTVLPILATMFTKTPISCVAPHMRLTVTLYQKNEKASTNDEYTRRILRDIHNRTWDNINKDAVKHIQKMLKSCKRDIVIIPIITQWRDDDYEQVGEAHATSLIINHVEKTVSSYDPNGTLEVYEQAHVFLKTFGESFGMQDYSVSSTKCPYLGPQYFSALPFCSIHSLLFQLFTLIYNGDKTSAEIDRELSFAEYYDDNMTYVEEKELYDDDAWKTKVITFYDDDFKTRFETSSVKRRKMVREFIIRFDKFVHLMFPCDRLYTYQNESVYNVIEHYT